jgi:hypothetical protein
MACCGRWQLTWECPTLTTRTAVVITRRELAVAGLVVRHATTGRLLARGLRTAVSISVSVTYYWPHNGEFAPAYGAAGGEMPRPAE